MLAMKSSIVRGASHVSSHLALSPSIVNLILIQNGIILSAFIQDKSDISK